MDEVGGDELGEEGGDDVGQEDDAFGDGRTNKIEGGGEDDHVEDIVDEAWKEESALAQDIEANGRGEWERRGL